MENFETIETKNNAENPAINCETEPLVDELKKTAIIDLFNALPDSRNKKIKLIVAENFCRLNNSKFRNFSRTKNKVLGYLFEQLVNLEVALYRPANRYGRSRPDIANAMKMALRFGLSENKRYKGFKNPDRISVIEIRGRFFIRIDHEVKLSLEALGLKSKQLQRMEGSLKQLLRQNENHSIKFKHESDQVYEESTKRKYEEYFEKAKILLEGKKFRFDTRSPKCLILPYGLRKIVREYGVIVPEKWRVRYSVFSYKDVIDIANIIFPDIATYPNFQTVFETFDILIARQAGKSEIEKLLRFCGVVYTDTQSLTRPDKHDFMAALKRAYEIGAPNFKKVLTEEEEVLYAKLIKTLGNEGLVDSKTCYLVAQIIVGGIHIFLNRFSYELRDLKEEKRTKNQIEVLDIESLLASLAEIQNFPEASRTPVVVTLESE